VSEAPPAPAELKRLACEAARAVGEVVTEGYGRSRAIGRKSSPTDVVTETDVRAEEAIRRRLAAATPHAGMLGEEGGTRAPGARLVWVIDPLDGTVNFLYGVPLFAVSIAAAVDGEVVAGAVLDVMRDELFSAHLGGGARCNDERIGASTSESLQHALVLTGFSYHAERRAVQGETVRHVLEQARDVRCYGSTALELCWVACARADAYFQQGTEIWDRAAGALIAAEAGARVELPCPENDDVVLAAAPTVFDPLWGVIQPLARVTARSA
jgi:myo-inositol-1(or 4)-monophosphatase